MHSSDNKELHLTVFELALRNVIVGELHSLTESEVGEVLLLLENLSLTMLQVCLLQKFHNFHN